MDALKGVLLIMLAAICTIACYAAGMLLGWFTAIVGFILLMLGGLTAIGLLIWEGIREYLEYRSQRNESDE